MVGLTWLPGVCEKYYSNLSKKHCTMVNVNKDGTHLSLHFAMASSEISLRLISFVPLYDPSEILQIGY